MDEKRTYLKRRDTWIYKFWKGVLERMNHLEDVVKMLDSMVEAGVSRIKVETSEVVEEGETKKAYHHGRCDVGSPFATGKLFDLEEEKIQDSIMKQSGKL